MFKKYTIVSKQIHVLKDNFDWQNVKFLDEENNYFRRLMSEMLHIRSNHTALNVKNYSNNLKKICNTLS